MRTHFRRWPRGTTALALAGTLAAASIAACSDEGVVGTVDRTPPEVEIVLPAEDAVLQTTRPTFEIHVSDRGSGVVVASIDAVINPPGTNVSEAFTNGYNPATGEIRVNGTISLQGLDGGRTLVFSISDARGNVTTVRRDFVLDTSGGGGGEP